MVALVTLTESLLVSKWLLLICSPPGCHDRAVQEKNLVSCQGLNTAVLLYIFHAI